MKNFKLLLASTAILSAGLVMNVMADNASVDLDAKITFVDSAAVSKVQDLDFGFIWANGFTSRQNTINVENEYITISPSGAVESGTDIKYFGKAKQGIVIKSGAGVSLYGISLPNSVDLKNGDTVCGTIKNFTQGETTYPGEHCSNNLCTGIGIGGTFKVDEGILTMHGSHGFVCTGTVTVSMVYNG